MGKARNQYPPSFKAKVTLEAIKEEKAPAELASEYGARLSQIRRLRQGSER